RYWRRERAELKQEHDEYQHNCQRQHENQIAERFLFLFIGATINHANTWRDMQADHNLLHGIHGTAEIGPLGAPGHHHDSQQVLAMNFSLARKLSDCCQRAESCGAAAAARQQGVANGFERSSVAFGESDAHRVYAIIGNYWRYCRFAFD